MSKEYKVLEINVGGEPNKWTNPQTNVVVYYIGVMLEGHDKPVSIGKKTPVALKVGDTVYGDIIPTDYLTDKWKHGEAPQGHSSSSSSDKAYLKDVTDMPVRFMLHLLQYYDVQKLASNPVQYQNYIETVKLLSEEALSLIDNVRSGQAAVPTPSVSGKEDTLRPATTSLGDQFRGRKTNTAEPALTDEDIPDFGEEQ